MDVLNPFLSHNYPYLMKRWRTVAKKAGLKFSKIGEASSYPCYEVFSPTLSKSGGIYLSAGIHGDETGAVLGLLQWAEENIDTLSSLPLLIYPCINPWGVENNLRYDSRGLDLNRVWDDATTSPIIARIMKRIRTHEFRISICLHEDYDAHGIYLYGVGACAENRKLAEEILSSGEKIIPRDRRRKIDGRKCSNGMIFPRPNKPPAEGMPEALFLYNNCGRVNFTLETPSELDIQTRAAAHVQMIGSALNGVGVT